VEQVGGAVKVAMVSSMSFSLGLSFFLLGSFTALWSLINSLQLIIVMSLIRVPVPANLAYLLQVLVFVMNVDVFKLEEVNKQVMQLDYSVDRPYTEEFKAFGYETTIFF